MADEINENRLKSWNKYNELLQDLKNEGKIDLPTIPEGCKHNAHMYYIKAENIEERTRLIKYLRENGVEAVFHYIPLHTAPAGKKFGRFNGEDKYTTKESERLLRLPMHYNLSENDIEYIVEKIKEFYK